MAEDRIYLNIPEPCTENWEQMTISEKGRYCSKCNKCVIDISEMSDSEILKFIGSAGSSNCVRARKEQLSVPAMTTNPKINLLNRFMFYFLSSLFVFPIQVQKLKAQETEIMPDQELMFQVSKNKKIPSHDGYYVLKGVVIDSLTGGALCGATIILKGQTLGMTTDWSGSFELKIPRHLWDLGVVEITYLGMETKQLTLKDIQPKQELKIYMVENRTVFGEIIIGCIKPPSKKWWQFWK